jgi:hypothetical protein
VRTFSKVPEREHQEREIIMTSCSMTGRKRKGIYKVGGGITYDLYDLTGHNINDQDTNESRKTI